MTWNGYQSADAAAERPTLRPRGDVLGWNHSLSGWDHLQVISRTNVISEAAPEI
jgi:hypothetical protein